MFAVKKYKAANSRRHKRLHADYLMKFQDLDCFAPPVVTNLKDISAGGVRFWTNRFIAEGTMLRISVLVPPLDKTIEALGRVQRIRAASKSAVYYISIGFIELNQDDQEAINQFIESISQQQGGDYVVHHPEVVTRNFPS